MRWKRPGRPLLLAARQFVDEVQQRDALGSPRNSPRASPRQRSRSAGAKRPRRIHDSSEMLRKPRGRRDAHDRFARANASPAGSICMIRRSQSIVGGARLAAARPVRTVAAPEPETPPQTRTVGRPSSFEQREEVRVTALQEFGARPRRASRR